MKTLTHITMVVAALALAGTTACSKSKSGDSSSQSEVTNTDVQGLAKETLLVMKFHHDN